jgi:hypothetical protein
MSFGLCTVCVFSFQTPTCVFLLGAEEHFKAIKDTLVEYIGLRYINTDSDIITDRMNVLVGKYDSLMTKWLGSDFPRIDLVAKKEKCQSLTDFLRQVTQSCIECMLTNICIGDFNAGNFTNLYLKKIVYITNVPCIFSLV